MFQITLGNNFHHTTAVLRPAENGIISVRAYKAAMRKLCGMSDCICGGIRGPQNAVVAPVPGPDGVKYYLAARPGPRPSWMQKDSHVL